MVTLCFTKDQFVETPILKVDFKFVRCV